MIIFNSIRRKNKNGRIAKFYKNYESLNVCQKILWHLLFINWIPMVASISLLLIAAILWNFVECPGFFYVSLGIVGIVFLPWIISGLTSIFKEGTTTEIEELEE